jgi:hypothetical protein
MTVIAKKKHINEITEEFRKFWEPYFMKEGIENPIFLAKLCYTGTDFLFKDGTGCPLFRMYAEQISKGQDVYLELYNWDDLPYDGVRALYKFKNNPNWRDDKDSYVEILKKSNGDPLPYPSYSFRLSHLELVNKSSMKALEPVTEEEDPEKIPKLDPKTDPVFDYEEEPLFKERDDAHYAQMTIRDIFCIIHKKPQSNKMWLNELIKQNI